MRNVVVSRENILERTRIRQNYDCNTNLVGKSYLRHFPLHLQCLIRDFYRIKRFLGKCNFLCVIIKGIEIFYLCSYHRMGDMELREKYSRLIFLKLNISRNESQQDTSIYFLKSESDKMRWNTKMILAFSFTL